MTTYTISDYLLDRLAELGVEHVFGVPGDYTLTLLDHVVDHPTLTWTGCTNELNAGYAADGYARLKGIGAVLTTFGVGELSAINALAGSYAEHVPVVEVVGSPASAAQEQHRMVHHSLGDGVFTHFAAMHEPITCARAILTPTTATSEIDRVLTAVRDQGRPGYLVLPCDLADLPVDPPAAPLPPVATVTDPAALAGFVDAACRMVGASRGLDDIAVLGGLLVHRAGAVDDLDALLRAGDLDHATTAWAKSLVDESRPTYLGLYSGAASDPATRARIEEAPVLVTAGVQLTDLNSGFFTQHLDPARTIQLDPSSASVGPAVFAPVALRDALRALTDLVGRLAPRTTRADPPAVEPDVPWLRDDAPLTQDALWSGVADFLRPGDIVLADQGTAFYGMATHRLPADVTFLGQPLWASIGYTLPALLGACLAAPGRRGVLLVGDGAAQMTVQELGTLIGLGIPAVVVVVDNDGYTVERAIRGPEQPYNDISRWDWALAADFFGPTSPSSTTRVSTSAELALALALARAAHDGPSIVQAVLPALDVPPLLTSIAQAAAHANASRPGS